MQTLEYREDRDLDVLLKTHAAEIEKLKNMTHEAVEPAHLDPKQHDEIFFLRYILSNKTAEQSIEAVKFTIDFRREKIFAYFADQIARGEKIPMLTQLESRGLSVTAFHAKHALDGGPVQLVRQGTIDFEPLLDLWTDDEMVRFTNLQKEVAWQHCDRVTRETRRLVKMTVINDFKGMRFKKPPAKWMNAFSMSAKIAEKMYPQLVETTVMVNQPSWFRFIFAFVKLFLTKRTLEKFRSCGGDLEKGDISTCPYVRSRIAVDHVPSYLGGNCSCPSGCVTGLDNDCSGPLPRVPTEEECEFIRNLVTTRRAEEEKIFAAL